MKKNIALSMCMLALLSQGASLNVFADDQMDVVVSESTEMPAMTAFLGTESNDILANKETVLAEHPDVAAFVETLYAQILGRESDTMGCASWVDKLVNQGYTAAEVVQGFFNSEEFVSKNLDNEAFVYILYGTLLGRIPSQPEVDGWVARKEMGVTNDYLLHGFVASAEFKGICQRYGVEVGEIELTDIRDQNIQVTGFCARMYTCCLGRSYDTSGLQHWVNCILNGGLDAAEISRRFYFSAEYQGKKASSEDFIKSLYHTFLNREPQDFEVERWAERRAGGVSDYYMLNGFCDSIEFKNICDKYEVPQGKIQLTQLRDNHVTLANFVVNAYKPLNRVPCEAEINNRIQRILNGESAFETVVSILESKEYENLKKTNYSFSRDMIQALCGRNAKTEEIEDICKLLETDNRIYVVNQYAFYEDFEAYCKEKEITQLSKARETALKNLEAVEWDLEKAFNLSSAMSYQTLDTSVLKTMRWYANYGFTYGKGNCYVMASVFCEYARCLGYKCDLIEGSVPLRAGGYGPHGWCEIEYNNETYVCDPDFAHETKRNGYMITYGQSGTWRYVRNSVVK